MDINKCSFLRARDPSILACNYFCDLKIRKNLEQEKLYDETVVKPKPKENLEVFLRIKKVEQNFQHLYEVKNEQLICKLPQGSHSMRNVREGDNVTKKYKFSKIFSENASQADLFNQVVKSRILDFINGRTCTLLTYGASGAGKTYTIVGTDTEPGIIPRALEYLFRTLPQLSEKPKVKPLPSGSVINLSLSNCVNEKELRNKILNSNVMGADRNFHIKTYKTMQQRLSHEAVAEVEDVSNVSIAIWVSFAEIYNEQIYDLLQFDQLKGKQRPKLKMVKHTNGQTYIKDLTCVSVASGLDAYLILQYGLHYLQYAATSINSHSSRSHSIFTIKLAQVSKNGEYFNVSCFNFCDLAGSERVKKTLNQGDRLKESNNINTSLLVLHRCISCIRDSQKSNDSKVVPFRESKLTQLFQRALSGLEDICMIVNINPILNMFDETQHVLNFSAIAKDIIVEPQQIVAPPPKKPNRFSQHMQARSTTIPTIQEEVYDKEKEELRQLVSKLYDELQQEKLESEENEMAARHEVINEYKALMEDLSKVWEARCKKMVSFKEDEMNTKLQELKESYESQLRQNSKKRKFNDDSIIDLDDSINSNQDVQKLRADIEAYKKQIIELSGAQQEAKKLALEVKGIDDVLKNAIKENKSLKSKIIDLEMTLQDATKDYTEQTEELEKAKSEIKELKSQLYILQEQQSYAEKQLLDNAKELADVREELEELEELNKNNVVKNEGCFSGNSGNLLKTYDNSV